MEACDSKKVRTTKKQRDRIILQRMAIEAPLWRKNVSYRKIREEVMRRLGLKELSLDTIHSDIMRMIAELRDTRIEDTEAKVLQEVHRLDLVIERAWEQFERSCKDRVDEVQTEYGGRSADGSIETIRAMRRSEKVCAIGDARYLDVILRAMAQRAKLLGLDRIRVDVNDSLNGALTITHVTTGVGVADSEEAILKEVGET